MYGVLCKKPPSFHKETKTKKQLWELKKNEVSEVARLKVNTHESGAFLCSYSEQPEKEDTKAVQLQQHQRE